MQEPPSLTLQKCGKLLLALAISDIFPKAKLAGGGFDGYGFYYDFILPDPLDETALRFINDRLHLLINNDIPFSSHEMMADNAERMLIQAKQFERAKQIERTEGLVPLARIDNFWDFQEPPLLNSSGEIKVIKVLEAKPETLWFASGKSLEVTRIFGVAAFSRSEFKTLIKERAELLGKNHLTIGQNECLFSKIPFTPGGLLLWQEKGHKVLDLLEDKLMQAYKRQNIKFLDLSSYREWKKSLGKELSIEELFTVSQGNQKKYLPFSFFECLKIVKSKPPQTEKGLYQPYVYHLDLAHLFCEKEKLQIAIKSSLQFIEENVNISGIESNWQFVKTRSSKREYKQIEQLFEAALRDSQVNWEEVESETAEIPRAVLYYKDVFGNLWEGPFVEVPLQIDGHAFPEIDHRSIAVLRCSLLGSMERFLAFCLESQGKLSLALQPWHGRIVLLQPGLSAMAEEIQEEARRHGVRLCIEDFSETFAEKMTHAKLDKFPFTLLMGGHPPKNVTLTLQTKDSSNEDGLEASELIERIAHALRTESVPFFLRDQRRNNKD